MVKNMRVIKCFSVYIILSVILFSVNIIQCQLREGSVCSHKRSQSPGTCMKLDDCAEAVDELFNKDINPQTCSILENNTEIVCCRNTVEAPPNVESGTRLGDNINRQMCREYAKSIYTTDIPFNVPGAIPTNHSECGFPYRPLVLGGELAKGKEFPHMALIGYDTQVEEATFARAWECGGTLISDQWVVTAAHCVTTFKSGVAKYVRLGELDFKDDLDDAKPQDFDVIERLVHPKYQDNHYNDIGLLKLHTTVKFSAYIRPACLWPENEVSQDRAIVTGWGTQHFFYPQKRSSHLQLAILSIMPESDCKAQWKPKHRLEDGFKNDIQICAGARKDEENKDACDGDSGGPIQIYATDIHKCMYYVLGVVSFGKPCGAGKGPGVYTRVAPYMDWIEDIVWRK